MIPVVSRLGQAEVETYFRRRSVLKPKLIDNNNNTNNLINANNVIIELVFGLAQAEVETYFNRRAQRLRTRSLYAAFLGYVKASEIERERIREGERDWREMRGREGGRETGGEREGEGELEC